MWNFLNILESKHTLQRTPWNKSGTHGRHMIFGSRSLIIEGSFVRGTASTTRWGCVCLCGRALVGLCPCLEVGLAAFNLTVGTVLWGFHRSQLISVVCLFSECPLTGTMTTHTTKEMTSIMYHVSDSTSIILNAEFSLSSSLNEPHDWEKWLKLSTGC